MTERETATVLAALRLFQEQREHAEHLPHFNDDVVPLDDREIDALCERLNVEEE
jgi:hypothetical protein